MTFLNFLPETYLFVLLFLSLLLMNFRYLSYRSLLGVISGAASLGLLYFLFRQDLAYFSSPLDILTSDSLSYYGKILSLVTVTIFSLGFHFHRELSFQSKQSAGIFTLLYALFVAGLFQSNNLILFLGSALGIYFCSMNLILLESGKDESWILFFRQRMLPVGVWTILIALLFVLGAHLFGSVYISDWVNGFLNWSSSESYVFIFAFLILMAGVIPLSGLRHHGKAPLGTGALSYGLFLIMSSFWLRLGIPFFSLSNLLSKNLAQVLISIVLGCLTLRFSWVTLRTRDHHRWLSSALSTTVGLSLFLILLPSEQASAAFFCISLSLLFTFALASHAFLDDLYSHKGPLLFSIGALVGAPPLILGEQFYRLVRDTVGSGNWIAGLLMMLSWFILTVAATQMMGKILLVRTAAGAKRKMFSSEFFFVSLFLFCVISLTAFRPVFVSFLNEHPVLNLW